jgi:hypothetical protein
VLACQYEKFLEKSNSNHKFSQLSPKGQLPPLFAGSVISARTQRDKPVKVFAVLPTIELAEELFGGGLSDADSQVRDVSSCHEIDHANPLYSSVPNHRE